MLNVKLFTRWKPDSSGIGNYDKICTDIFVEDRVHYNRKGYNLYGQFFREILKDEL